MKATHILLGTMIVATAMAAMAPPATAGHGPTSCTAETGGSGEPAPSDPCTFYCHKGDQLTVTVQPNDATHYGGQAILTCGGVTLTCWYQEHTANACQSFPDTVQYDDAGTCDVRESRTRATCTASPTPLSGVYAVTESRAVGAGVPGVSTPLIPSQEIWTPGAPKTCTPANLLCIGPVDPQYITTIPGASPIPLTPASGVSISWTDPSLVLPTIETGSTGPYPVVTEPVPVTLCDPSCDGVPTGVSGGPSATVTVTVYVGATVVSHDVTLP